MESTTDLRYPIGRFTQPGALGEAERSDAFAAIAAAPAALRDAVAGLEDRQLDTPYRPDGWTVRQVVHHLPDSHLNAYVRTKLAVTEDEPTIKTYDEKAWAELADARGPDVAASLALLAALHIRWVAFLRSLPAAAFGRKLHHPEIGEILIDDLVALYAWHGRHHVAQITALRRREGW